MITDTSLTAYKKIELELGERQLQVYNALKHLEYATNTMISNYLNIPINCVTGRTNELREKQLVIKSHTSLCPITKNRAIYWKIKNEE